MKAAAASGEIDVARRSRRKKPSLLQLLAAVFLAVTTLIAVALRFGLGEGLEDSIRLAAVISAVLVSVSVLSLAITLARARVADALTSIRGPKRSSSRRTSSRREAKAHLPRGLVRRVDRRAGKRIRSNGAALARKRHNAALPGEFGVVDPVKWKQEQDAFIDAVILADVEDAYAKLIKRRAGLVNAWRRRMDAAADDADRNRASAGAGLDFRPGMGGFEYEAYCARVLSRAGWKVFNKGDSGDQGVDLIAKRGDTTVAIQCKRYRGSVGNKAVQEIFAGKTTVDPGAYAAVVSNAEYTRSAKELAAATHVYLLHHDDLPNLADIVAGRASALAAAA